MNWEFIKFIYRMVLIHNYKIEYFGRDKYRLTDFYSSGEKLWEGEYQNGQSHGKHISWSKDGQKLWENKHRNGKLIK